MVKNLPAYVGDRFDPYVWEGSTCLNYCAQVPLSPCSATREASEVRSRVVVPPAATRESPCTDLVYLPLKKSHRNGMLLMLCIKYVKLNKLVTTIAVVIGFH